MREVIWRPITGADNYEASSDGEIRSIDRVVICSDGRVRHLRGCILKQFVNPGYGHMQIKIRFNTGARTTRVHVLVCSAFHGLAPSPLHQVRHLNGVRDDNRSENLRWGTASENQFDRVQHGNHPYANKTHCNNGHPFDEGNTYREPARPNARFCRTCRRENGAKRRKQNPETYRKYQQRCDAKRRGTEEGRRLRNEQSLAQYHTNRDQILARRAELRAQRRAAKSA